MKGDVASHTRKAASMVDLIALLEQVVIAPLRGHCKKICAADARNWIRVDLLCVFLFDNQHGKHCLRAESMAYRLDHVKGHRCSSSCVTRAA